MTQSNPVSRPDFATSREARKVDPSTSRETGRSASREEPTMIPPVDVVEDATGITLYADLPGVPKDRLDVRVEADTLTIDAELALAPPQGMTVGHADVHVTRYRRTFTLSKELDAEQVDAEFAQGVLRIRLPKARDAQPRRIAVDVR